MQKKVYEKRLGRAFTDVKEAIHNPRVMKEFETLNIDNPMEVMEFIERMPNPRVQDYVWNFWYNNVLSGIPTHVVNIASNTAHFAFQLPHRALQGGLDAMVAKFKGREREIFTKEVIPMMAGAFRGVRKGRHGAWEVMRTGKAKEFSSKWDRDIGKAVQSVYDRAPLLWNKPKTRFAIDTVGNLPTRGLIAMDVWANTIAFDAQMSALATREALKKIAKTSLKGREKEIATRSLARKYAQKPEKWMMDNAAEFAKYCTFMNEPGKMIKSLINLREGSKYGLGRIFVPFINTIANLTKRGLEMTPGVGLMTKGTQTGVETAAKQIEGVILSGIMVGLAMDDRITGALPKGEGEQRAFWRAKKQPWSIKIGNTWYSYRRIEPFNTVLASAAIACEQVKNYIEKGDDASIGDLLMGFGRDMVQNLVDSTYLQGIKDPIDPLKQKGFIERQIVSFIPGSSMSRSMNRAIEAFIEESSKVRSSRDLKGAVSSVIPMGHKIMGIGPKINIWGEDIEMPGGPLRQFLPYKWSEETSDMTEKALAEVRLYPNAPGQHIKIPGIDKAVRLPDDLYADYQRRAGKRLKIALDAITDREWFKDLDKVRKKKEMRSIILRIRADERKNVAYRYYDMHVASMR